MILRKKFYSILTIILISCILLSFTLTTAIPFKISNSEESSISLKLSATKKFERNLEFLANNNTSDTQQYTSICTLSDTKIAMAWQDETQDGSNWGVYSSVFDATTGNNITKEFRVNNYTTNAQQEPSICTLSDDTFAVVWGGSGQDGNGYGIFASVFNATKGTNITSEFQVNDFTTGNQRRPSICTLSDDTFAIAWESFGQDGNGYGIFASVFNATKGTNITSEFQVNDFTTGNQQRPSICTLSEDIFAVTWESYLQDDSDWGIYASVFNATTGSNITSEFQVNYNTIDNQIDSSICALSVNTFAVTWTSDGQDGHLSGVYMRMFDATTGNNITSEFQVNYNTTDNQWGPSICTLSGNTFAVAWVSNGQDGSDSGIYARVFDVTTGNNITSEFRINNYTEGSQFYPFICTLSDDTFAVAWNGEGQDDNSGVYVTVFKTQVLSYIIIPTSDDDDDNDDDNGSSAIPSYNLYVILIVLGLCMLILRRKIRNN